MHECLEVPMGHSRNSVNAFQLKSSPGGRYAPRTLLAVCLALMIGCSSCDRFGQEKSQDAEAPADAVQKMPLPRHAEEPPQASAQADQLENKNASEADKAGAPSPAIKQTPQQKKEDAKPPQSSPDKVKGEKGAALVRGEAKLSGQTAKANAKADKKPAPAAAKTTLADKKAAPAVAKASAAVPMAKKKSPSATAAASSRTWTVVMGPYLLEETMASDLTRVRKAGLSAKIQSTPRQKTAMNRLFLAQFDDRATAQTELDRLKRHTSDAFILEQGGKHAVYAGSYLLDSRALSEKERLAAAGFSLTVKRTDVAVPSRRIVAGTYHDRAAAETVQKKLRAAGVRSTLVH
jgi:hypothetical protein